MTELSIIGIDLAKRVFQLHGVSKDGTALFRKKLQREAVLGFLAGQSHCTVAMEACASAHYWGREIRALGHEVRLLPPANVSRSSSDTGDQLAWAMRSQSAHLHTGPRPVSAPQK